VSAYSDGRRLEYEAARVLRVNGYEVIRSAGSKGKVDLAAFKQGELLFVQCKLDGKAGPAERAELRRLAMLVDAAPLLARWHKEGRTAREVRFARLVASWNGGPFDQVPWTPDHALEAL
jgi:Holliday junction resolvase